VPAASQGSEIVISSGDSSIACAQAPDWRHQEAGPSTETTSLMKQLFSGSESDDPTQLQPETKGKGKLKLKLKKTARKEQCETRKQNVCHPKGFQPISDGKKGKGKGKSSKPLRNPYSKEAFLIWSSDSDFQ